MMESNGHGGKEVLAKEGNPGSLAHAWQEVRSKEDEMGCLPESEGVVYLRAGCNSTGTSAVKLGQLWGSTSEKATSR